MTPDRRRVASAFLEITLELMADPAERAAFERWLSERDKAKAKA